MKLLTKNLNGIIVCVFEALIGILLLINPISFTAGIFVTTGIVMLVIGLLNIIRYFRTDALEAARSQTLAKGLIGVTVGGFCIFKYQWFIMTFPILTIVYGIVTLMAGFCKIQWTVDVFRLKKEKWVLPAISALLSIICAIVILKSPFTSTAVLWTFTGVSLIVEAIFDIVTIFLTQKEKHARSEKKSENVNDEEQKNEA